MPPSDAAESPTVRLARFFTRTMGEPYDEVSRLWVNVRHVSRHRPLLAERELWLEAGTLTRLGQLPC
jgi:hypothetical protein